MREREEWREIYKEQNKLDSENAFENQNLIEMWPMLLAPTQRGHKINKGVLKISGCKMSCFGNNTDNLLIS